MLTIKQQPPSPAWVFSINGITFKKEGEEPFVFTTPDKKADLDPSRKGFINRVLRYTKANGIELTEQDIYQEVQKRISASFRKKYFTGGETREPRVAKKALRVHPAPIPPGLMEAARSALGRVVASESDEDFLHDLTAKEWLLVLGEWKRKDQNPTDPMRFGPVFWMAIHVLGITQNKSGFENVRSWISAWHSSVPCKNCRAHFGKYAAKRPISWGGLKRWASAAHDWTTANKEK